MGGQDILVLPTVESSLTHKFLSQLSQSWAAVRVSCHQSIANQQIWKASLEIEIERKVEWDDVINDPEGVVLDDGFLLGIALDWLREQRLIVFGVVFAEPDCLSYLTQSLCDRLAHFLSDVLGELLLVLLKDLSHVTDQLGSLLNCALALNDECLF